MFHCNGCGCCLSRMLQWVSACLLGCLASAVRCQQGAVKHGRTKLPATLEVLRIASISEQYPSSPCSSPHRGYAHALSSCAMHGRLSCVRRTTFANPSMLPAAAVAATSSTAAVAVAGTAAATSTGLALRTALVLVEAAQRATAAMFRT